MATERQIRANRANSLKSTGPRSKSGKAASAQNSLVHGLTAAHVVLEWEDPVAFETLRRALHCQYDPANAMTVELVEQLAALLWRLRRSRVYEGALITWITHQQAEAHDPFYIQLGSLSLKVDDLGASLQGQDHNAGTAADQKRVGRMLEGMIGERDMLGRLARYERHLQRQVEGLISALAVLPRRDFKT